MLGEQGRAVDGRVHLLELANTELEAKYIYTDTHHTSLSHHTQFHCNSCIVAVHSTSLV